MTQPFAAQGLISERCGRRRHRAAVGRAKSRSCGGGNQDGVPDEGFSAGGYAAHEERENPAWRLKVDRQAGFRGEELLRDG